MPFKSKAQAGFMFAKHPDIAKRWVGEMGTGYIKALPQHVKARATGKIKALPMKKGK